MLQNSSLKYIGVLSALISSLLLTSCLRGPSEPTSQVKGTRTSADFRALQMQGESIDQKNDSVWKIPNNKTYQFTACLVSRNTNTQLPPGQEFYIEKSDQTRQLEETNDLGCLVWNESISFDFTADSNFIEMKRKVTGRGTHRGSIELRYAVNPWVSMRQEAVKEFLDLNQADQKGSIVESSLLLESRETLYQGSRSEKGGIPLLIEEKPHLKIRKIRDIENGKRVELIFDAHPFIQPLNLSGNAVPTPLMDGLYRVYIQVIANYGSEEANKSARILTPKTPYKVIRVNKDNLIRFQEKMDLTYRNTNGRLELAIKLVPLQDEGPDGDQPLDSMQVFEGRYDIGEFNEVYKDGGVTQVQGHYSEIKNFNYSKFLRGTENYNELAESEWVQKLPPVNYDFLNPRFVRVKAEGETATYRNIIYRVSTRVTDSVTGAPIPKGQKFKVRRDRDNEEIEVEILNDNGMINWTNTIDHQYYQPEQFYKRKIHITHINSKKTESYDLYLNPWDSGWTFGMDGRDRKFSFTDAQLNNKNKLLAPRLMVDAFRYQTIRFRYVIDEYLTLNVKKAVVMALDPLVQKQTINRGRQFEPLRDGIYLAKIALVKYYLDPFKPGLTLDVDEETNAHTLYRVADAKAGDTSDKRFGAHPDARKGRYTSIIKKLIRVQAGRITTPLEFSMRDLRMMSIRSNIIVQLETIDENKLLADNIMNQKLEDIEKLYYRYNCINIQDPNLCFSDEEKSDLLAKMEKDEQHFYSVMGDYLQSLKRARNDLGNEMQSRDATILSLEESGAPEQEVGEAYGGTKRSIFDLPEGTMKELLAKARENMPFLSQNMDSNLGWSHWSLDKLQEEASEEDVKEHLNHIQNQLYQSMSEGDEAKLRKELYRNMIYADDPDSKTTAELKADVRSLEQRSYQSYLLNMNAFLGGNIPGMTLSEEDFTSFERNNYRENPAVPLVDLNLYRNSHISGLAPRAFIGPCTLVENDNMSEMRPTDTIDEGRCKGIDCHDLSDDAVETRETVDNSEFEKSVYHDSLIDFKDRLVDDYVGMHRQNEINYKRKMEVLSQMGNFATTYNLDFVSLRGDELLVYQNGCQFDKIENDKDCYKPSKDRVVEASDFLSLIREEKFESLLQRYFYINPLSRQAQVNNEVDQLMKQNSSQSLEPLFPRVARESKEWWRNSRSRAGLSRVYDPRPVEGVGGHPYQYERWKVIKDIYDNKVPAPRSQVDVRRWLKDGRKSVKLEDALALCHALARHGMNNLVKEDLLGEPGFMARGSKEERAFVYLRDKCFENVKYLPNQNEVYFTGVSFDRRYKVLETGPYEHIAGKNMNLNVGIDFGITGYGDSQTVASLGINSGDTIKTLGIAAAGIGAIVGLPLTALAGGAAFVAGTLVYSKGVNSVDGTMKTTGTSVNAATFLVVQQADIALTIERHLKCLSTQYSDQLVKGFNLKTLGIKKDVPENSKKLHDALTRGFFICDSEDTNEKELVLENYYYVTQHFTAGDMLDDVNLLNHVWLLALRGKRDFNTFLDMMKGREVNGKGEVIKESNLYDYSLNRLGDVYNQVIPTFPGMYTPRDQIQNRE